MQTMISSGVQLKKQQSELKLEAELTVRALVKNVCVLCVCAHVRACASYLFPILWVMFGMF